MVGWFWLVATTQLVSVSCAAKCMGAAAAAAPSSFVTASPGPSGGPRTRRADHVLVPMHAGLHAVTSLSREREREISNVKLNSQIMVLVISRLNCLKPLGSGLNPTLIYGIMGLKALMWPCRKLEL